MTDIVERLRNSSTPNIQFVMYEWMKEAADEIERLRREREIFSQALDDANEWGGELYADNERLRKALQEIADNNSWCSETYLENIAKAALKEGE